MSDCPSSEPTPQREWESENRGGGQSQSSEQGLQTLVGKSGAVRAREREDIGAMVQRVESYGRAMWKAPFDRSEIETLLIKAYEVHDAPFNEAAAAVWAPRTFQMVFQGPL